jgi:hypothetical protein
MLELRGVTFFLGPARLRLSFQEAEGVDKMMEKGEYPQRDALAKASQTGWDLATHSFNISC